MQTEELKKGKNMQAEQIRHGENMFVDAKLLGITEIPKEAKLIEKGSNLIVGHSETGHHHTLTVSKTAEIEIYEYNGMTLLYVPEEAKLEHQKTVEKHETKTVSPGIKVKIDKHSYSYAEKVTKRVID